MHVGHFAVGMVAKRIEPKLSLGTLVLAAMLADFLWCIFMLAGIDHVEFKHGMGAANYLEATEELKGKVKGAMVYPAVVSGVASSVTLFLMVGVIPTFKKVFSSFGQELRQ